MFFPSFNSIPYSISFFQNIRIACNLLKYDEIWILTLKLHYNKVKQSISICSQSEHTRVWMGILPFLFFFFYTFRPLFSFLAPHHSFFRFSLFFIYLTFLVTFCQFTIWLSPSRPLSYANSYCSTFVRRLKEFLYFSKQYNNYFSITCTNK